MNTQTTVYTSPVNDLFDSIESVFNASPYRHPFLLMVDDLKLLRTFADVPSIMNDDKYPPINIFYDSDNHSYILEFAVAGFKKEQLQVELSHRFLTVSAKHQVIPKNETLAISKNIKVIAKGLAKREFKKSFIIPTNSKVDDVSFADGILTIKIVKNIPDSKPPEILEIR